MEKVDQDYLDAIIFSNVNNDTESDDKKCLIEDPMEIYENIKADAVNLGKGNMNLDMEIIMKFLQVRQFTCLSDKMYSSAVES